VLLLANAPVTIRVDGFGPRTNGVDPDTGDEVERLDLAPKLVEHAGFVTTLAERVARLSAVRHTSYVHLRRLDRPDADHLELVSDFTPGWRLSELLSESNAAGIPVDITVVISLLRQLLPAVALFGRHNREAAIGALAVERLFVAPHARLIIAEHAFGPALDKLDFDRDRLWRELRIAMPPSNGLPRANQRGDAYAIGIVTLSLLLGRVLEEDEFQGQLESLLDGLREHRAGRPSPLSSALRNWLNRALQVDPKTAFQSPSEMQLAFEGVLASDRSYVTTTAKFEEWIANVGAPLEARKRPPAPPPPPPEPEPEPVAIAVEPEPQTEPEPVARVAEEADPIAEQIASYKPSYQEVRPREPQPEPERKPAPSPVLYATPVVEEAEPARYIPPPIEESNSVAAEIAAYEPATPEEGEVPAPEPAAYDAPAVVEETESAGDETGDEAPSAYAAAAATSSVWAAAEATTQPESAPALTFEPSDAPARSKLPLAAFAGVIVLLLVVIGWLWTSRGSGMSAGEGELAVQSRPPGARVIVDGKDRGVTPTTVRLPAGPHVLEVQVGKAEPRVIPLTIAAGVQTSQYIELRDVATTGSLSIKSEPPGARITIDGQPRGTTPATIPNLTVGDHAVVLELAGRTTSQSVRIAAGSSAQLTVPMPRR
jgi:hypothetical protein